MFDHIQCPVGDNPSLAIASNTYRRGLGVEPGDAFVLAPTNAQVALLRSALQAAGVPSRELARYEGVHGPFVRVGTFPGRRVSSSSMSSSQGGQPRHGRRSGPASKRSPEKRRAKRDVRAAFVAMTRARARLDVVVSGSPAAEIEAAAWAFNRY